MTHFIDRRLNPKGRSTGNRRRFIGRIKRHPHRQRMAGLEHEVITVLMHRGGLSYARRLIKELQISANNRLTQQFFSQLPWLTIK